MRWGKIILLFQAIITLAIGIAFFSQLTVIGASDISEIVSELINSSTEPGTSATLDNIKAKYTVASYILLIIGLIEVILIMRLLS